MTKQEKIQEAYGNGSTWNRLKINTDSDGWCRNEAFAPNTDLLDLLDLDKIDRWVKSDIQGNLIFRPKSLDGIEDNNGWVKGIPIESGQYFAFNNESNYGTAIEFSVSTDIELYKEKFTHYQKIEIPNRPIF
jgi:hypothetical protein